MRVLRLKLAVLGLLGIGPDGSGLVANVLGQRQGHGLPSYRAGRKRIKTPWGYDSTSVTGRALGVIFKICRRWPLGVILKIGRVVLR